MNQVQPLRNFDQIKQLADPRRLNILRLLMSGPATLTQLAQVIGESPAWVRHHIKALEAAGLVEVTETRTTGIVVEKFYRARAGAYFLHELVTPLSKKPTIIFAGSHDLAIELLSARLEKHITLLSLPVGSLDGLVNLRMGVCQISGSHILEDNGEYNAPTVRHLFPDRDIELVTLAYRTQGLLLPPGNPKQIQSLQDLMREDVTFLNRNPGSGTRIWLERELARLGLPLNLIRDHQVFVYTHTESARAVQKKTADVSLGIMAIAHEFGLDFIPLFEERYDLVLHREQASQLQPILDHLQTKNFRQEMTLLQGYATSHTGEKIHLH